MLVPNCSQHGKASSCEGRPWQCSGEHMGDWVSCVQSPLSLYKLINFTVISDTGGVFILFGGGASMKWLNWFYVVLRAYSWLSRETICMWYLGLNHNWLHARLVLSLAPLSSTLCFPLKQAGEEAKLPNLNWLVRGPVTSDNVPQGQELGAQTKSSIYSLTQQSDFYWNPTRFQVKNRF